MVTFHDTPVLECVIHVVTNVDLHGYWPNLRVSIYVRILLQVRPPKGRPAPMILSDLLRNISPHCKIVSSTNYVRTRVLELTQFSHDALGSLET